MLRRKRLVKLIKLLFLITLFVGYVENYRVGSRCGFPGVPHDTKIEPSKRIYEDGDEITYRCPSDEIYIKTQIKKCESGEWVGSRSTCGHFIVNQLKQVRIVNDDQSSENYGKVIYDEDVSNFTATKFPASFLDKRASKVVVYNANKPHKWYLHFTNPLSFDFFLLNVRTPKKSGDQAFADLIDNAMVRSVSVVNEPDRNCTLDFNTRLDYAKVFWIWCTKSAYHSNQSTIVSFVSYSNQNLQAIGLHHTYFTRLYYCGRPEVPLLGVFANNRVQCDPKLAVEVTNESPIAETLTEEDGCVDNAHWAGYPTCKPRVFCIKRYNELSETIISVQNAFKFNATEWLPIEDTVVEYKCANGYVFAGNSKRTCKYNGTWDEDGPICVKQSAQRSAKQASSSASDIIVWVSVAVFIILAVIAGLVVYFKCRYDKLKKESIRSVSQLKKPNDYYDSVEDLNYYAQVSYGETPLETYEYPQLSETAANMPERSGNQTNAEYLPIFDKNDSNVYIQMSKK